MLFVLIIYLERHHSVQTHGKEGETQEEVDRKEGDALLQKKRMTSVMMDLKWMTLNADWPWREGVERTRERWRRRRKALWIYSIPMILPLTLDSY